MKQKRWLSTLKGSGFLLLICSIFLLSACAPLTDRKPLSSTPCISNSWPQEKSDLAPDPDLTFGRLDNGLRYVLLAHDEPQNRVGMYLDVQAGSIQETEKQRGLAHYLEHMLFNGTTHYPPGTLVEYFQSIGMGFGADTNAHTGFDETVYKLLLPNGKREMVDEGLQVLADYSRGALLLEEEVDRERGVILAEKRSRDSVAARMRKKQMNFEFAGTRAAQRDPIGTEEVLLQAGSADLRTYYDAWYRPENMVVVVVGDMSVDDTKQLVAKHFSGLKPGSVQPECSELGVVAEEGLDVLYLHEPELGYTRISYGTVYNEQPSVNSKAWEQQQLYAYVAASILNNRLEKLARKPGSPFTSADVYSGIFLDALGYATITASTDNTRWQEGLSILQQAVNQTLDSGFRAGELERIKKELLAYLKKQQQTAKTRSSSTIAAEIIRKLNSDEVILSPAQELALYKPMLEAMTVVDAEQAFARLWKRERRLVQVVGTVDLGSDKGQAKEQIVKVLAAQSGVAALGWEDEKSLHFPYLEVPTTIGKVQERKSYETIGMETVLLAGGVRINFKKTPYQRHQVQVAVHFGQGKLSEPTAGMARLAEGVVRESGVGGLTREQLNQVFAGTNVELGFKVGSESLSLTGTSLAEEFEMLLQLIYAQLHDPAFRKTAFEKSRERAGKMYDQIQNTVEGQGQLVGAKLLTGDNPFYTMATRIQVKDVQLDQVVEWLQPVFSGAPLEINIVGDIDQQHALALAQRYFGQENRIEETSGQPATVLFPQGQHFFHHVNSSIDKALVTVAWQTDDFWDISRTRRLNLLASVLGDRLRLKVREELGATYSPVVYNQSSRTHEGFGILQSKLTVSPDQARIMAGLVKEVAAELGQQDIDNQELERALEPTLTSIRDMQRNNSYWLNAVMVLSSRHSEQLQWPLSIVKDFQSITAGELRQLAEEYLSPELAAEVVVSSGK